MSSIFTGSLQPKKKGDLQSLADALNISSDGTKEELYNRLKKHLDKHQDELETDPQFSGLFDRRRKRKESAPPPSKRTTVDSTTDARSSNARRVVPMVPLYESTPAKDLSDVSAFLKHPETSPNKRTSLAILATPSSSPPLPTSPETSMVDQSFIQRNIVPAERVDGLAQVVRRKQDEAVRTTNQVLFNARAFLSNSRTIWIGSALIQLLYIYISIVPWQHLHIPFSATSAPGASDIPPSTIVPKPTAHSWTFASITIPYPPLATFQSHMFWTILLHWAIPTVLVPVIAGILISFKPPPPTTTTAPQVTLSESREISRIIRDGDEEEGEERTAPAALTRLAVPFDPLTASIARLAAEVAYTYPKYGPFSLMSNASPTIESVDVLGSRWRIISASVGLAFAFAEAISGAGLLGRSGVELQTPTSKRTLRQHETVDTVVDSQSEVD
ncbi:hypothetical protein BT96DRAFT_923798 [Gymnopus androsaceus JB14]|uniref:SAP domain-containing protein n=1 Tax=Gymnopus androsaceus JB14 TaxID=1447944 RepID=A0A6A4H9T8_9AGAR|nr:hypothetical protein BT96DRAFT_923798 [Gymnopus androsaceus JB14]